MNTNDIQYNKQIKWWKVKENDGKRNESRRKATTSMITPMREKPLEFSASAHVLINMLFLGKNSQILQPIEWFILTIESNCRSLFPSFFYFLNFLCFVWFSEKCEKRETKRKVKNRFKVNKLFLYIIYNYFTFFNSLIWILNNLKMYKILINFNYINIDK